MYYTFTDLRPPVESDTVWGCLAHYFSSVNYCATTADCFILGGQMERMVASYQNRRGTMTLTLQKKCDPALTEGRYCWETCCRPLGWNLLVGWSRSVADDSENGHTSVSWHKLQRQITETSTREVVKTSCKIRHTAGLCALPKSAHPWFHPAHNESVETWTETPWLQGLYRVIRARQVWWRCSTPGSRQ